MGEGELYKCGLRWVALVMLSINNILVIGDLVQSWCEIRVRFSKYVFY